MSKIIIEFDGVSPEIALRRVERVVREGQISTAGGDPGIPHYCWVTVFDDVNVYVRKKRTANSAESFLVTPAFEDR